MHFDCFKKFIFVDDPVTHENSKNYSCTVYGLFDSDFNLVTSSFLKFKLCHSDSIASSYTCLPNFK